jgi:hypothetical protein
VQWLPYDFNVGQKECKQHILIPYLQTTGESCMKTAETNSELPGRTFLKSTLHVRIRKKKGNYMRSVAVGIQFGIIHLPYEIIMAVIFPVVKYLQ